jgi:RNA polymerase sigma-70 factor (ECF subfamily)
LIEAMNSLDRFDGRCLFATWLHGILRHRYLKSLRADRRRPTPIDDGPLMWLCVEESDPSLGLDSAEESAVLRQEVAALADAHREVIELRFFAEASLAEIAAALDIPVGTVKSRLHHALEKLRQSRAVRTGSDRPVAIGWPPRDSLEDPIG